jgi:hypothetical protein
VPLLGAELKLVPGLMVSEEYTDNVRLTSTSRQSDYVTTLAPSLVFSSATEQQSLSLSTGISWLRYESSTDLDATDYFLQGGYNYSIDPRLSVSTAASYVRNSRPDRIDLNGLTLRSGSDRKNFQMSGVYAVSEKSTSSVSYAYSNEVFDNPGVVGTTVHTVNFSQDYGLDRYLRQAKLVGNFGFFRNLTDTSTVDNYTLSVGLTKKIHELWYFSLMTGGRYTHSEFDAATLLTPTQVVLSDETGWVGSLSINYSGETMNGSLAFNNDVTPASGRGGTTQRTGVSTSLSERFTRDLSGYLSLWYSWNRSNQNQYSGHAIDEKNLTFNTGLQYELSPHVFLDGNYRHTNIQYNLTSSQASQNVFMLRLTMKLDLLDL